MRDIKVDTLRGLACIFLVAYHVIGNEPSNGLKISGGILREINDLLECVRMPLFTFLSGMVYAMRPLKENWQSFLKGKVRRLLLPMFVVGTIFAIMQSITPGTNNNVENWWLLHIYPVQHFWFVESLFLVFLIILPLEIYNLLKSKLAVGAIVIFFLMLSTQQPYSKIFAFKGFVYLMPFFLFGVYIFRFGLTKLKPIASIFCFFLLMALVLLLGNEISGQSLIGCLIGLISCYLLLGFNLSIPFLARIGIYSYSIYIFHVFFTAATRILITNNLSAGNITDLFLGLAAGILGPIVVFMVAKNNRYLRLLLLGQRM